MQCLPFPFEVTGFELLQQWNSRKRTIKIPCVERMHVGDDMEFILFLTWLNGNSALFQVQRPPLKTAEIS